MRKLFQLMLVCGGLAAMNACNNKDGCEDTVCQNGGVCVEGDCQCPDGYSGPNCEISSFENGVFVVHEGGFQAGNASLSFYSKDTELMSNGVFSSANGSVPLGDVAQSMELYGDRGYIVVNNSGKIEVVDLKGLTSVGTISGLSSPRYMAFLSDTKAYVSDLFSTISVINPQTLAVVGSLNISGQTEHLVVLNDHLLVAGTTANQVYKVSAATDEVLDSVNVGIGPSNLAVDANGKLWVLTNGGWGTEVPKLVRVNPSDMTVELTLNFPSTNNYPGNLEISGDGNTLYYVDGQVYQMSISDNALPTTAFSTAFAYKCGVDPTDDVVYVSDAGDFVSNGKVYRYQSNGTPIDTFNVGVIPAEYAFTE